MKKYALLSSVMLLFSVDGLLIAARAQDAPVAVESTSVLIRNVRLIDRDGEVEDVSVNILIRDNKLDVVTEDEIATAEAELAVDALNGILLGALELGQPPSFLILDEDPRENFDVLLDTATYTRFAIYEGEIVRNTFETVTDTEPESVEEPRQSRWLAYTPPPMALPLSYQDSTKWNRWETEKVSGIFVAGLVLDRQNWLSQDDTGRQQVGDLQDFDGGEIRGLRFGAVGTLNFEKPWVYTVFAATNAFDKGFDTETTDDVALFDYRLDIPVFNGATLSVGKQKEPISMERLMSLAFLPMQERTSVSDALLPSRNVGVVLSGAGANERMTWAGGLFNDSIDTDDSFSDSSSQLIGRMTWLPFISEDESNLVHLGFGLRYTNAKEGISMVATEPEFNQAPLFVDTGFFEADSAVAYNLEASWRKGPFWVAGEYIGAEAKSPNFGDPNFSGYHVTGSWALTGEMRPYYRGSGLFGGLPVARSVNQGGWGTLELGVRWSELDLTDGLIDGGEMGILSVGVNWWLTPVFGVSANVRHISLDRAGISSDSVGFMTRVVLLLE